MDVGGAVERLVLSRLYKCVASISQVVGFYQPVMQLFASGTTSTFGPTNGVGDSLKSLVPHLVYA